MNDRWRVWLLTLAAIGAVGLMYVVTCWLH